MSSHSRCYDTHDENHTEEPQPADRKTHPATLVLLAATPRLRSAHRRRGARNSSMSRRERQKRRRRSRPVTKVMLIGAVLAVCGIALGAAAAVGWVVATADNGPNLTELKGRSPHPLTQIFAADGSSLGYVHSDTVYNPIPVSRIPKLLREATIAIE